jgi:hypothetical protein
VSGLQLEQESEVLELLLGEAVIQGNELQLVRQSQLTQALGVNNIVPIYVNHLELMHRFTSSGKSAFLSPAPDMMLLLSL